MDRRAIGVFDSGIGGLTVVKAIRKVLPKESLIYLGDTARVPYGTRSHETLRKFARQLTKAISRQDIKALVVACNTISATALDVVKKKAKVPVLGVIEPTLKRVLRLTRTKVVGVMATKATVSSGVYQSYIKKAGVEVIARAAPMLVPIVEEGLFDHPVARMMVEEYTQFARDNSRLDVLVLGCTHYPILRPLIEEVVGAKVRVIDSAHPTAATLKKLLAENKLMADGARPTQVYFTSDEPGKSHDLAKSFLGEEIELKQIIL